MNVISERSPEPGAAGGWSGQVRTASDLLPMLVAIWHETHTYRAAIHRSVATGPCDLSVSVARRNAGGNGAIGIDGECECRDFLVDMIAEGHRFLISRAGELHNPLGAVRVHVRTRAIGDWTRRRRTEMGAQARVDRIRTGARARDLPDEDHRALLEYLVDEAGAMAPLESEDALLRRLATRRAAEFGGSPEEHITWVADALVVIERHCRSGPRVNVGTSDEPDYVTWWERYIDRPLGRRSRRTNLAIVPVPNEDSPERSHGQWFFAPDFAQHEYSDAEADTKVLAILVAALRQQSGTPADAMRTGIVDLVTHGLLGKRTAADLLADQARFMAATHELSALG